jgi:hypothetical protein
MLAHTEASHTRRAPAAPPTRLALADPRCGGRRRVVQISTKTLGLNEVLKELNTATGMNVQHKELKNAVQALVDSGDAKLAGSNITLVRA